MTHSKKGPVIWTQNIQKKEKCLKISSRWLLSLTIRDLQIKTIFRVHLSPVRKAKNEGGVLEKGNPNWLLVGLHKWCNHYGIGVQNSQKESTVWSCFITSWHIPKGLHEPLHRYLFSCAHCYITHNTRNRNNINIPHLTNGK